MCAGQRGDVNVMCAACAVRWLSCSALCPRCAGPCAAWPVQCAPLQRDRAGGDVRCSRGYARRATCFVQCANGDIRFCLVKPRCNRPLIHAPNPGRIAVGQENRFGTREATFTQARTVLQVRGFAKIAPRRRRDSVIWSNRPPISARRFSAGRGWERMLGKWNLVRGKDCGI